MDFGQHIREYIRDIPDFPREGILFKDITPLLKDGPALKQVIQHMAKYYGDRNIDLVVGPESRGFLFGTPLAFELGIGFVPVRKPGKLPAEVTRVEYALEYGTDALEMHTDAIRKGQRVLIVDDLLATGGTTQAAVKLVEKLGGEVAGLAFLIELSFLKGRSKLNGYDILSLITY